MAVVSARFVGGLTRDSRREILAAFTERGETEISVKPSRIKEIFHKFQEIDKDGSGRIDYAEFREVLVAPENAFW